MKRKIIASMLTAVMAVTLFTGCGSSGNDKPAANNADGTAQEAASEEGEEAQGTDEASGENSGEAVTIKLFSNLPDRKNGQGLVEQMIIDEYMSDNPNVTIQVEALDEEAYKTKFKAYAMGDMPDVVSIWGQPAFLDEVLDEGVLAELNESDYADYGFIAGSLEGFKKDGKLYGLPRNTDILVKVAGTDYAEIIRNAIATGDFTAPEIKEATQILVDSAAAGMFQTGYDSQDYGTTMNGFYDWNIVLDEMGGPNHAGNFCDAPFLYDTKKKELIRRNTADYLWHFTHFIKPGAVRIGTSSYSEQLEVVAFLNPDGKIAAVLLNRTRHEIEVNLRLGDVMAGICVKANSIVSAVIDGNPAGLWVTGPAL